MSAAAWDAGTPLTGTPGQRIRTRRLALGLRLADLAEQAGVSVSFLSQVERDRASASVQRLHMISEAMGLPMAALFGETPAEAHGTDSEDVHEHGQPRRTLASVVRADRRLTVTYPGSLIRNELLVPDLRRALSMMYVVIPVGADTGSEPLVHEGEECGFVVSGQVGVWVGEGDDLQYFELGPGDAISQSSEIPHRSKNIGDVPAVIVTAQTPPSL